jgi:DNA-binding NarL/FixJ family response regulator
MKLATANYNQAAIGVIAMIRVMICEDDPLVALDLASAVANAGATTCGTFSTSVVAIKAARALKPDFALVDLRLADGDTAGAIAATLEELGCKVVIVSGGSRTDPVLFAIPHVFVAKPVADGVLAEILK